MPDRYIQPLRAAVQLLFFTMTVRLGIDFFNFVRHFRSAGASPYVARPEGIEAFLPVSGLVGMTAWIRGLGINPVHPAAMVLFLTIIAISFLLRRSFCSFICPIGTISEIGWKTGYRIFHRNIRIPRWPDISLRSLKYLLLLFFLYTVSFSISTDDLAQFIFSDYHKVADIHLLDFFINLSFFSGGILLLLFSLSIFIKNPFCRYLCPYGALLGVAAIFSPLRITRNRQRCVSCGVCDAVCPSHIDVMNKSVVISPECLGCFRCVSHCRAKGALSMNFTADFAIPGILFVLLMLLLFWGGKELGIMTGHWKSCIDYQEYSRLLGG